MTGWIRTDEAKATDDVRLMDRLHRHRHRDRYPPLSISLPFLAVGALPMMTTCHRMFLAAPQPSSSPAGKFDPILPRIQPHVWRTAGLALKSGMTAVPEVEPFHGHPRSSQPGEVTPRSAASSRTNGLKNADDDTVFASWLPRPSKVPPAPPPPRRQMPSDTSPPLHARNSSF